jgi:hypothetical protein
MAKSSKQASQKSQRGKGDSTQRYSSMAEINRDLFPNAAAEEAKEDLGRDEGAYERLMGEVFGPRHPSHA